VPTGGTATFTLLAAGNGVLNYAWYKDGILLTNNDRISGTATSTLTISNVSPADVGSYGVFVSDDLGVFNSSASLLTIASPPSVVSQPANQAVLPGATAIFAVGAVGTQPLSYQWLSHGTNSMAGASTNALVLRNVSAADAGAYSVVVSNSLGSVTNSGALLTLIPVTRPEVTLTTLYSFRNAGDGANPNGLVLATNGLLYGIASSAGANGSGTAFRITTNGVLTTLHPFTGGTDGAAPKAALIQAADGSLYGTTFSGGANYGGTVFRMTVGGVLTTLHAFSYGTDGGNPLAPVIQVSDGNFYGTTVAGGDSGDGNIFRLTSTGAFISLHSFTGADGNNLQVGLVQGNDGNFYGTTRYGGANPYDGTVFRERQ
jgi:uncharacterized repeat protein (TIGR03803 family)